MWIVCKTLKVGRGDEMVTLNPGDPVPEAATWHNLKMQSSGRYPWVKWVDDIPGVAQSATAAVPAVLVPAFMPDAEPAKKIVPAPAVEAEKASIQPSVKSKGKQRR